MYAIIETGGKQYKVQEGDVVYIEKLNAGEGEAVSFDKVLLVSKESGVVIGSPTVAGASVSAKVEKQGKGKKSHRLQVQSEEELSSQARSSSTLHEGCYRENPSVRGRHDSGHDRSKRRG